MKEALFSGSGCALVTPMLPDGSLHPEALGRLIDYQLAHSTDALIVCGTTGEAATLSDEEQRQVIDYSVKKSGRPGTCHCRSRQQLHGARSAALPSGQRLRCQRSALRHTLL